MIGNPWALALAVAVGAPSAGVPSHQPEAVIARVQSAAADAEQARDERQLKIRCAKKVDADIVTFVNDGDGKVLLAAVTDKPLEDASKDIWLSPSFTTPDTPVRASATQDWAFVHDSNRDGKIDHIAFLIGPLPIEPEKGPDINLPVLKDSSHLSRQEIYTLIHESRFGYWQFIDENFDGTPDTLAIPARNIRNGWYRGWALVQGLGQPKPPYCRMIDRDGSPRGDCTITERDIAGAQSDAHLWSSRPAGLFAAIARAAKSCRLKMRDLRP